MGHWARSLAGRGREIRESEHVFTWIHVTENVVGKRESPDKSNNRGKRESAKKTQKFHCRHEAERLQSSKLFLRSDLLEVASVSRGAMG